MATIPDSAREALETELAARRAERWPTLRALAVRYHGAHAYIDVTLPDDPPDAEPYPLFRLTLTSQPGAWEYALYNDNRRRYQPAWMTGGEPTGTPAQALDDACELYHADLTYTTD
ncbi:MULTISPECIES: hypothetical protein [unclassified Pseudofrankia]|uniref:hypothetical protein n=1 Tax=unclassified Pseudofrankia TaxID=2994372 RepID=UPI0008D8DB00|nr:MULTISPECIES: hypothetical protein [unclassified Pseudofrankia]MDT3442068.1 hypothetical protein [Pseudofrankia sp. BMG5.37]OHV56580.1 hypothetical protein BCD48_43855 [Pseudofrankia sp. BMG5.36]OHV73660.1 hypothetical protein BCD48_33345 [Pseudofrankia sp. BMG5.36]